MIHHVFLIIVFFFCFSVDSSLSDPSRHLVLGQGTTYSNVEIEGKVGTRSDLTSHCQIIKSSVLRYDPNDGSRYKSLLKTQLSYVLKPVPLMIFPVLIPKDVGKILK